MTRQRFIVGTRKSKMALWQTEYVCNALIKAHPEIKIEKVTFVTSGDKSQSLANPPPIPEIGGKGLFTAELEEAIRTGEIDFAVHSLKDLPTAMESTFTLGAIIKRESARDVLVSNGNIKLDQLPAGSVIGTSSLRRAVQIKKLRADLVTTSIRGNVDTRLSKLRDENSPFDAIMLAEAGLFRLGLTPQITESFEPTRIVPAPAQGAVAVQCRIDDLELLTLLKSLDHSPTRIEVTAERSFLSTLNAGCSAPVGAIAALKGQNIYLKGRCLSPDGDLCFDVEGESESINSVTLGQDLAKEVLKKGYSRFCH